MPGRVHPLTRAVDVVLELPDRRAPLELLDDVAAGRVSSVAMRMADGDRDAGLTQLQRAQPVLDDHVRRAELLGRLADDVAHLALCHALVRRILHARHRPTVVHVANTADEQHRRAIRGARDFARERGHIDRPVDERGPHQPPATGGMIATSSPDASTCSGRVYRSFTASIGLVGRLPRPPLASDRTRSRASPAVAPGSRSSAMELAPSVSAYDAKR